VRPRLLAGAVVAALWAPVLDPRQQLFWRDTQRFFHPFKLAMADRLRRGELPLWDPWTESGVSVLGQLTPALWHPTTLLYVVLPFPLAFKLNHLIALPVAVRRARSTQLLFLGVLACAALVVAQSLYRSWVVNFQGQGRYLFPILPMFFFYWRQCEERALRIPALLVASLLGTLSLLSFALIGLASLA